jgi:ABC-2 type transport system ATP-binding protein
MNPSSQSVLVEMQNLVKSYQAGRPNAVNDLSFAIQAGSIFGLLGPNGAGKTTTIKMILGLVLPTSGKIHLAGFDVSSQRDKVLKHTGAVLEGSRNIYWRLSARANLEYFGALRGMHGPSMRQRINEILELVDLSDRADEETRQFSRGMQQKVALGVAILHDPDVLLLDEPTLGLDVQSARVIEDTIRRLVNDQKKAVLLTTHQMALAEKVCDQILVINKGEKVAQGSTREVIHSFGNQQEAVEIRTGATLSAATLARIREIQPGLVVKQEGEEVLLTLSEDLSQKKILDVLNCLDAEGIAIKDLRWREATLEEVFIRLTTGKDGSG